MRRLLFFLLLLPAAPAACDKLPFVASTPKPPPSSGALRAVCTSDFGGETASVRVWRDDKNDVFVLELLPDRSKNALAPTVFFDERGREQERIAAPGSPSSPSALEADRKRDQATSGSSAAETIPCARDAGAPAAPASSGR